MILNVAGKACPAVVPASPAAQSPSLERRGSRGKTVPPRKASLSSGVALNVVLEGSVAVHPRIMDLVQQALIRSIPEVRMIVPEVAPVIGATQLAMELMINGEKAELEKQVEAVNHRLPTITKVGLANFFPFQYSRNSRRTIFLPVFCHPNI
jgi:hypothetical protein